MYGLLSIVSHHSVFKYFVIKIISIKPMMFFFLLKGENDFLQPRESLGLATARAIRKRSKPTSPSHE